MNTERLARWIAVVVAVGIPLAALVARGSGPQAVVVHGKVAEAGGWSPADLAVEAGEPLHLRLTSDDVIHGFAIGQSDWPEVEVKPGVVSEVTITFDEPGKYTFYCTRWCGPNHWRMRGTIEVSGANSTQGSPPLSPLYQTLGIDIDALHSAATLPAGKPSAARGATRNLTISPDYLTPDYYFSHSPAELWQSLRANTNGTSDEALWDAVARVWMSNSTKEEWVEGQKLYAANCAACHGETGAGDGVMAETVAQNYPDPMGQKPAGPARLNDPATMLGASPALLQGKILRGGMGTGMPYWGPIFTEAQTWALVNTLYSFVMEAGN